MKFCYCPECKELHPRNWRSRGRCERCDKECIMFSVKRTMWGTAMYVLDAIAIALLVLDVAYYQNGAQWANFISVIPESTLLVLIFGTIIVSFVFAYLDLQKTTAEARRKVESGKLAVVRSEAPGKQS